jgi:phosphatidylinositol kinase/protein kinase (PI-3  family)
MQAEMDKYDKLPLERKVDRLKGALSHSNQSDLKDVLWQRSPSAEIWIRRRTNFARTVGVGSGSWSLYPVVAFQLILQHHQRQVQQC